ncbi:MAG: fumarylacetoacetate hydrolase family protein [Rhodospirillales bacterium]|nr:fumarylacetoacetate hydrolase family protein [Rhodospirillales bacterium]
MRFVTFEVDPGKERLGIILADGRIADLQGASSDPDNTPVDMQALIESGEIGLELAKTAFANANEDFLFAAEDVTLKAPLPRPHKIIAAGKNFSDHSAEMGRSAGNGPIQPVAFAQAATTVVGPDASVPYPPETSQLDYEVEMAVIIGTRAFNVDAKDAYDYVFGYTMFNDISARDVYRAERPSGVGLMGKNLPSFAPMGPMIVTKDEIKTPQSLGLRCRVNGETRQNSTLGNMIFKIDELIAHWSQTDLRPGDMVTTGTPSGVAAGDKSEGGPRWLKPGDVVEIEVDGLGTLTTTIGG